MIDRLSLLLASSLFVAAPALAAPSADPLAGAIKSDMPGLLKLYTDLHKAPELSNQEYKTSARLAREIAALGFKVTPNVGGTGLVAVLENGPGPVVMIRADIDGLPVTEATGLPYASTVKVRTAAGVETGVMHACGHDIHMTGWIGAAKRLVAMKAKWSGTLVMIAQPAEEIGAGARAMLADGLYSRFPKPAAVIAFHDSASLPAGTIGYTPGYALANVDSVDIVVKGIGGHGAYPHTTKDPIVIASRIVGTLQTIVSREVDPQDAAVVTVGSFHAGTKHNIIPAEARLQLTVRTYSPETRATVLAAIKRIAEAEAMAAGMPSDKLPLVTIDKSQDITATYNTQPLTDRVIGAFRARFGDDRVRQIAASMGGEDFSEYWLADKGVQSLIFWVGGVPQADWDKAGGDLTKLPSIHSAYWAPDPEPTIATAVEALTTAALQVLASR